MASIIKRPEDLAAMRRAGALVADTFAHIEEQVREGVSLRELDALAEDFIRARGAEPAYLGYGPKKNPFPATICASVNEVICHGIPEARKLRAGDIVGIDIGVRLGGFYGDACRTYAVGAVRPDVARLVEVTERCLDAGVAAVRHGARSGDIGHAIQRLAEEQGFSVVREYTGHGIGRKLHDDPTILHYGQPGKGFKLVRGMVFTIEPMINLGAPQTRLLEDGWTVVTADGSPSAQFEHTVVVTDEGCEVLSLPSP